MRAERRYFKLFLTVLTTIKTNEVTEIRSKCHCQIYSCHCHLPNQNLSVKQTIRYAPQPQQKETKEVYLSTSILFVEFRVFVF